jgi:hypothetical protein
MLESLRNALGICINHFLRVSLTKLIIYFFFIIEKHNVPRPTYLRLFPNPLTLIFILPIAFLEFTFYLDRETKEFVE